MVTVTKKEMILRLSAKTDVDKDVCRKVLQTFLDEVIQDLKSGNRVEFRHFGVFTPVQRKGRVGRNPKTGKEVTVPPRIGARFRPGLTFKKILAGLPVKLPQDDE